MGIFNERNKTAKRGMYYYDVGVIINNLHILEQTYKYIQTKNRKYKRKSYRVKCVKDNHEFNIIETDLSNGHGCPVCSNKIVVKGVNDIATTNPESAKFFANIEDTYKYTYSSGRKVLLKCPLCLYEKERAIYSLHATGFTCKRCGDGISYPEKLIFNILEQLGLDFKAQLSSDVFKWCDAYRYDFYVKDFNFIIEAHGGGHYVQGFKTFKNGKTLDETKENDRIKKELALKNNIDHYIVIDCRKSDMEFIKQNILNSELPSLLNFKEGNVDWLKCEAFACSSRVREACYLWNNEIKNAVKISEIMNVNKRTVWNYLKIGNNLGWCEYNPKLEMQMNGSKNGTASGRSLEVFQNGISLGIFPSCHALDRQSESLFGVKLSYQGISAVATGRTKQHQGFTFKYVEPSKRGKRKVNKIKILK